MGRLSIIKLLPDSVRKEIDRRLIDEKFSNYERHARALTDQGYPISKSMLHRYGQEFEHVLQRARDVERLRAAGVDLAVAAALANNPGMPRI